MKQEYQEYKNLTQKEASDMCGKDGVRFEGFNMVGKIFYKREGEKWIEIKDFNE